MAKKSTSFRIPHSLRVSIAGLIFMLSLIPMTMYAVENQQDIRQHAAEITISAQDKANEDISKCRILKDGQPGTPNFNTLQGFRQYNDNNDPIWWFGSYYPSTDPNDSFFTDSQADGEGRWAGAKDKPTDHPYWHGGPFRPDGTPTTAPGGVIRVGGFYYLPNQDTHLLDHSGHANMESNWNWVMRTTEDIMGNWYKDNNPSFDQNGKFIDRNCVLQTVVFRHKNMYTLSGWSSLWGYNRVSGFFIGAQGIKTQYGTDTNPIVGSNDGSQVSEPTPTPTAIPVKAVQVSAPKGSILAAIGIAGVVLAGLALFGGW